MSRQLGKFGTLVSIIPEKRFGINARMPHPMGIRRVSTAQNTVANDYKRLHHIHCHDRTGGETGGGGTTDTVAFVAIRTGENVDRIRVIARMDPALSGTSAQFARIQARIIDNTPTTTLSGSKFFSLVDATATINPSDQQWVTLEMAASPHTDYRLAIETDAHARIGAYVIYELAPSPMDTTNTGVNDPVPFQQNSPIYQQSVQDLLQQGTKLWQHNATVLWSFSAKDFATNLFSTTGTTWKNLHDPTHAVFSASSIGTWVSNLKHDTSTADIPLILMLGLGVSGGGTGEIELLRSGSTWASLTGIVSNVAASFDATAFTAPAINEKVDLMVRGSTAGTTVTINRIALMEYET